jgi:cellulose biosynthesis protein BcsQ
MTPVTFPERTPDVRVALLNNKGGVGKSMATVYLAEALARAGRRVLVVDMDPQANATSALGVTFGDWQTLAECLSGTVTNGAAADYLLRCGWIDAQIADRIAVLPSSLALEDITMQAGLPGSHMRLRRALYGVDDAYDVTLLDCPPSMGHLTANVLAALDDCEHGDTAIVVTTPTKQAFAGALRAKQFIATYAADLGVCAEITGLIVNQVRGGTTRHEQRVDQLAATFPGVPVLGSPIALRAAVGRLIDDELPLSADNSPEVTAVRETFDAIAASILARQIVSTQA